MKIIYFFLTILFFSSFAPETEKSTITVEIDNIKTSTGQIIISAYTSEKEFTDNPKYFYRFDKKNVQNGKLKCVIKDLQPGKYSFTLLDDTNKNDKMDYNFVGLPKEGYGFSNNLKASIKGAPNYNECLVNISQSSLLKMTMQYW
jgi:uncharacterized protein (DUF2141 family)